MDRFDGEPVKAAFITGAHPYDAVALWNSLTSLEGVAWYPQSLDNFAMDVGERRNDYDVLVFYHFHQPTPGEETEWWEQGQRAALESIGSTDQGVVLLHHSFLAFPDWEFWSQLSGIADRRFTHHPHADFAVRVIQEHPITSGIEGFEFGDETYVMDSADEGSTVLLATESPKSMASLAWTRTFGDARVFCYQSGHGELALSNQNFRRILRQGIGWAARPASTTQGSSK
jgi:type 1 glutamine amidotransferase